MKKQSDLSRDDYQTAFFAINKSFCRNIISLSEYKSALSTLLSQYRKDFPR